MWYTGVVYLRSAILWMLIAAFPEIVTCLRDVSVTVPTAVKSGDNAVLVCNYDMEGDTLYSVKWYKGRREFFRYTPKENPAMKTFSSAGVNVDRLFSNESHVVLTSVKPSISGKFSCEVSADAPSFHTKIVSGEMEVVELPQERPAITGIQSRYRLGDLVIGNCTSDFSKPAANLSWTINDSPAPKLYTRLFEPLKSPDNLTESSTIEISFMLTHLHLIRGRLKLKCTARIHNIYEQDFEKLIEEDHPRILASGRSPDVSLFPFEQQNESEQNEQGELYLTHYKASDVASSSSSSSSITCVRQNGKICWIFGTIVDGVFYIVALGILSIIVANDFNGLTSNNIIYKLYYWYIKYNNNNVSITKQYSINNIKITNANQLETKLLILQNDLNGKKQMAPRFS